MEKISLIKSQIQNKEERYMKHDFQERFTHWAHVIDFTVLLLTGFQITHPSFALFGSMATARFLHIVSAYAFIFLGIAHVYFFFAEGKWKVAMPTFKDIGGLGPTLKYYFFLTPDKPDYAKYNPLQKFSYAFLFLISAFQVLIGLALYWPLQFQGLVYGMGGLMIFRAWHLLLTWVFVAFTIVHLYLVFSEDVRLLYALLHGYYYRRTE